MTGQLQLSGSNSPRKRVRVEYNDNLREQLTIIANNQAEQAKSQATLEIRIIEKMELNHTAVSRDLGLLRNDVTDLRASYNADKQAYERRFLQLEARPPSSWEMDKQGIVQRLQTIENRPAAGINRAMLWISILALISGMFFSAIGILVSVLIAVHAIG